MLRRSLILSGLFSFIALATAQEDAEAPPPKPKRKDSVQIVFLPPPMKGAISLGIYDGKGKLARVLHREAGAKDFTVGQNGFITEWDGKDDAGQPMPPGKYAARGWLVGDTGATGVAFHCNDWVAVGGGPRFTRVTGLRNAGRDEVRVTLRDAENLEHEVGWTLAVEGSAPPKDDVEAVIDDGKLSAKSGGATTPLPLADGEKAVAATAGTGGNIWAIVEGPTGRELRAYTAGGEFLRRLAYAKDEPVPRELAASRWSETVFLLEESGREQRLRALALTMKDGASTWKTVYQKRILPCGTFAEAASALGRAELPAAVETVKVQTKPNPLLKNARSEVGLQVTALADGAVLKTADGLPLTRLSETKGLKWAVFVREGDALTLFESDGVAVGEFKISKPNNMMAFDAGEYELRR
jgi:hypothetical protein